MSDHGLKIRCMRCGEQMEMRDPGAGKPWMPDQFWVCPRCGRHFWTTYPTPPGAKRDEPKPAAAAPAPAAAKPPVTSPAVPPTPPPAEP